MPDLKKAATVKLCGACGQNLLLSEFHRDRSSLDGYFDWCRRCRKEKRPIDLYSRSSRVAHLAREQLVGVLRQARAHSEREWILLLVTFWHRLRASEAVALTPEHFADGYLTVQRLKGSRRTTEPLVATDAPLLNERAAVHKLLAGLRPGERLFPVTRFQFYRLVRRYGRLAGLPQHLCHPQVLKHSRSRFVKVNDPKRAPDFVSENLTYDKNGTNPTRVLRASNAIPASTARTIEQLAGVRFCQAHLERAGIEVAAAFFVGNDGFCSACFAGKEIGAHLSRRA